MSSIKEVSVCDSVTVVIVCSPLKHLEMTQSEGPLNHFRACQHFRPSRITVESANFKLGELKCSQAGIHLRAVKSAYGASEELLVSLSFFNLWELPFCTQVFPCSQC